MDATLGSGNLKEAVRLPPGEDINEWLAVNSMYIYFSWTYKYFFSMYFTNKKLMAMFYEIVAVDFFNQVNLLYGTLAEFCTPTTCPTMSAGPK